MVSDDSDKALDDVKQQMPWTAKIAAYSIGHWLKSLNEGERMTFFTSILIYVLKLDFLDGMRTTIGGVASVLFGIALIGLAAAGNEQGSVEKGVAAIVAGITIIGAAAKADKAIAATKAAAVLNVSKAPTDRVGQVAIDHALKVVTSPANEAVPLTVKS